MAMADDEILSGGTPSNLPKGNAYGGRVDTTGLPANVLAVMSNLRWTTTDNGGTPVSQLTYYFPTSSADYFNGVADYGDAATIRNPSFAVLTPAQQAAVLTAFDMIEQFTQLRFVLANSGTAAFQSAPSATGQPSSKRWTSSQSRTQCCWIGHFPACQASTSSNICDGAD